MYDEGENSYVENPEFLVGICLAAIRSMQASTPRKRRIKVRSACRKPKSHKKNILSCFRKIHWGVQPSFFSSFFFRLHSAYSRVLFFFPANRFVLLIGYIHICAILISPLYIWYIHTKYVMRIIVSPDYWLATVLLFIYQIWYVLVCIRICICTCTYSTYIRSTWVLKYDILADFLSSSL